MLTTSAIDELILYTSGVCHETKFAGLGVPNIMFVPLKLQTN